MEVEEGSGFLSLIGVQAIQPDAAAVGIRRRKQLDGGKVLRLRIDVVLFPCQQTEDDAPNHATFNTDSPSVHMRVSKTNISILVRHCNSCCHTQSIRRSCWKQFQQDASRPDPCLSYNCQTMHNNSNLAPASGGTNIRDELSVTCMKLMLGTKEFGFEVPKGSRQQLCSSSRLLGRKAQPAAMYGPNPAVTLGGVTPHILGLGGVCRQ